MSSFYSAFNGEEGFPSELTFDDLFESLDQDNHMEDAFLAAGELHQNHLFASPAPAEEDNTLPAAAAAAAMAEQQHEPDFSRFTNFELADTPAGQTYEEAAFTPAPLWPNEQYEFTAQNLGMADFTLPNEQYNLAEWDIGEPTITPALLQNQQLDFAGLSYGEPAFAPALPQDELDIFAAAGYGGAAIGPFMYAAPGYVPAIGTEANEFSSGGQYGTAFLGVEGEGEDFEGAIQVATVDAGVAGVERQVQMGNPGVAKDEQAPPQIQAQARAQEEPNDEQPQQHRKRVFTKASTQVEPNQKAGKKVVIKDGRVVQEDRREARSKLIEQDYDPQDSAKAKNLKRKRDIASESASEEEEWVVLQNKAIQSLGLPAAGLDAYSRAHYQALEYVPRIQSNAETRNKNAVAKWKSEDRKRQRRFECWQLARFWASHAGVGLPVYGEKTKNFLRDDWERGIAALDPVQRYAFLGAGPK